MNEAGWDGALLRAYAPHLENNTIFLGECGSTNDEARKFGREGLADGTLILTEHQTAGRGRRGQAWICPAGESIACSFLVRPSEPFVLWPRLSLAAGLAVAEALDSFGIEAEVKWPNDVWVGEKKICGILLESESSFAIIGIGLNVNTVHFPDDLAHPATSLALETGIPRVREEVLGKVAESLSFRTSQIGAAFAEITRAWNTRCVLRGRRICLETKDQTKTGVMKGLSQSGELLLETATGTERVLHADQIRLV